MPRPTGRPSFTGHPPQRGGYAPRPAADDGGMTVRVDPRRLGLLKQLAAEAGVRPGELVQAWVEQRLDAERAGGGAPIAPSSSAPDSTGALAALASRLDDLVRRIAAIEGARATQAAQPAPSSAPTSFDAQTAPRKRGRPRKVEATAAAAGSVRGASPRRRRAAATLRIALHDEIIAAIRERGPLTAAELATAVKERGKYRAPRSAHPIDAAIINSRVSNPVYRARFRRNAGRIGLAEE